MTPPSAFGIALSRSFSPASAAVLAAATIAAALGVLASAKLLVKLAIAVVTASATVKEMVVSPNLFPALSTIPPPSVSV